jgi:type IV pilus biogenesis protein PilP
MKRTESAFAWALAATMSLVLSIPVYAAEPVLNANIAQPTASTGATGIVGSEADELGALDKQAALWKKRAEIARYKAEVSASDARQQVPLSAALPMAQGALPPLPAASQSALGASHGRPTLVRIGGADGRYDALIDVDGHTVDAFAGDTLEGGWRVVAIDAGSVHLLRGKQQLTLRL